MARYSGGSDRKTELFDVAGQWEIAWSVQGGDGLGIAVRTMGGVTLDDFTVDPGDDRTIVRRTCTCYLELLTSGSTYTVVVTDLPG